MSVKKIEEYVRIEAGKFVIRLGERRNQKSKQVWFKRNGSGYRFWAHLWLIDMMW